MMFRIVMLVNSAKQVYKMTRMRNVLVIALIKPLAGTILIYTLLFA